jgi:hypothetical protein
MGRPAHFRPPAVLGRSRAPSQVTPESEERRRIRKRQLCSRRKLTGGEPAQLGNVVGRHGLTRDDPGRPAEIEGRVPVLSVPVRHGTDEANRLDLETRLLTELPPERVERLLELVHEAAEDVPLARGRLVGAAAQQHTPRVVDDEPADRRGRFRVDDETAFGASDRPDVPVEVGTAAGTRNPPVQLAHDVRRMTA